jgi:hypothetical protein
MIAFSQTKVSVCEPAESSLRRFPWIDKMTTVDSIFPFLFPSRRVKRSEAIASSP